MKSKQNKLIRNIDKDVWIKLKILSMNKELSIADTIKLLVLLYEKQKSFFEAGGYNEQL